MMRTFTQPHHKAEGGLCLELVEVPRFAFADLLADRTVSCQAQCVEQIAGLRTCEGQSFEQLDLQDNKQICQTSFLFNLAWSLATQI